jgi:hypothetical protein
MTLLVEFMVGIRSGKALIARSSFVALEDPKKRENR